MLNTPADLVITEIMYNPPESGTDTSEFIEIYNNGANAVNLLNFTCTGGIYTFPNVSLAAGAYYVITVDSSGFYNTYGFSADGVFTSGLSNGGESIVIKNPAGTVIDSVFYDDVAPWPSGFAAGQPDGGGASLILCDVNTDNNIGSNWSACTTSVNITINGFPVLASPGVANVCAPPCNNPDVPTVTSNPTTVCDGLTTTLTITGNLNDASKWYIYTGSCGGTIVDSTANSTYVVTPAGPNTTYYVRGEGNCVVPGSCGNVTINVLPASTGSVTNTICNNDSIVVNGTVYNANNPSGTEVFVNGGANGCDSTVTINLTVLPAIDITTTVSGNTITANETGATYQWLDCDNGNAVINGETSQSFTATVTGNYAVEITVGNCVDTSACENVTVVGIDELSKTDVTVYPNPTNGIITVDFSSTVSSIDYTLMSIDGKTVAQGKFSGTKLMLNLENESKGIYFLKVENATINYVQKVFKH